jgi:hypothetical protein
VTTVIPISLGDYAKHRRALELPGTSKQAVSKAISSGRLVKSIVRDANGAPKVADAELADREWAAGTDHSKAPGSVKERASAPAVQAPPARPRPNHVRAVPPPEPPPEGEPGAAPLDLNLAQESAREKHWKANAAEIAYRERVGQLVDSEEMKAAVADAFTRVRGRLAGLPTRIRQQIPHLAAEEVAIIEALVREALEELALKLESEEEDDDGEPDSA